jgi:hypothetical protein
MFIANDAGCESGSRGSFHTALMITLGCSEVVSESEAVGVSESESGEVSEVDVLHDTITELSIITNINAIIFLNILILLST